jgi:TatD DNase family protein
MYIDAHCHLNSLSPFQEQNVLLACAQDFILIDSSIDLASSRRSLELSRQYPFVYSALGFHPSSFEQFDSTVIAQYQSMIDSGVRVVAIGEIGLDIKTHDPASQEKVFREFLGLAKANGLPVMIHNRGFDQRTLEILDEFFVSYEKVIFHCFSSGPDVLKHIVAKGGQVSFSLNVLRKKALILDSLNDCPLESVFLETDSPYMKIKDRESNSLDVKAVYDFAAAAKGLLVPDLSSRIQTNAFRLFKLAPK